MPGTLGPCPAPDGLRLEPRHLARQGLHQILRPGHPEAQGHSASGRVVLPLKGALQRSGHLQICDNGGSDVGGQVRHVLIDGDLGFLAKFRGLLDHLLEIGSLLGGISPFEICSAPSTRKSPSGTMPPPTQLPVVRTPRFDERWKERLDQRIHWSLSTVSPTGGRFPGQGSSPDGDGRHAAARPNEPIGVESP